MLLYGLLFVLLFVCDGVCVMFNASVCDACELLCVVWSAFVCVCVLVCVFEHVFV